MEKSQTLRHRLLPCVRARAHVSTLMTRKWCAVEMRNAILRNNLKLTRTLKILVIVSLLVFHGISQESLVFPWYTGTRVCIPRK